MLDDMEDEAGVRFELKRERADGAGVSYAMTLEVAERRFEGAAAIASESGAVRLEWRDQPEPPEWCVQAVRAQLRLLHRDSAGGKPYPRRVTRWRPAPRA